MTALKRRLRAQKRFPLRPVAAPPLVDGADWSSVLDACPSSLWVPPEPVKVAARPPIPMTREQSRAYKRIRRVAQTVERRDRARWATTRQAARASLATSFVFADRELSR